MKNFNYKLNNFVSLIEVSLFLIEYEIKTSLFHPEITLFFPCDFLQNLG